MHLKEVREILRKIVISLSQREYDSIYQNDEKKEVSAEELREVLEEYGGDVIFDEQSLNDLYFYFIDDDNLKVDYTLIIDNVVSDLTLTVHIHDREDRDYSYSINNLHAL